MIDHGFKVTSGYLGLETAWRAEYIHGAGGKVIGINSGKFLTSTPILPLILGMIEMDALPGMGHGNYSKLRKFIQSPGIGHGCGHNLIAASGCGVAIALKVALETHKIPGKIILLGTPAEEEGGGKIILLERGGYDEMDFCVMYAMSSLPPFFMLYKATMHT